MNENDSSDPLIPIGPYTLNAQRLELFRGDERIKLQSQPMRLLALLASRPGETVSHEDIYRYLWGNQVLDHAGGLHVCIRQIRTALDDDAAQPSYIQNVPRRGYRLVAPAPDPAAPEKDINPERRNWLPLGAATLFVTAIAVLIGTGPLFSPLNSSENPLSDQDTASPARNAFLRGQYLLDKDEAQATIDSRAFFGQAIEIDDTYAPAYSAMAASFQRHGDFANSRPYAEKATMLAPELADAQLRLGAIAFFHEWDWSTAERRIKEALRLDPDFTEAHHAIATVYSVTGRLTLALAHMEKALALDPASTLINADYGYFLYYAGDTPAAIAQCTDAMALAPDDIAPVRCIIKATVASGQYRDAIRHAVRYLKILGADPTIETDIKALPPIDGLRLFEEWRRDEARREASQSNTGPTATALAVLEAQAGNPMIALAELERALKNRDAILPVVLLDPVFAPLYREARFEAIVSSLNITLATDVTDTSRSQSADR